MIIITTTNIMIIQRMITTVIKNTKKLHTIIVTSILKLVLLITIITLIVIKIQNYNNNNNSNGYN